MIGISSTQYIAFDSWNLAIDSIYEVFPGTAMNLTQNYGILPTNSSFRELSWTIMYPQNDTGYVLVIDYGDNIPANAEVSIQIYYNTTSEGQALQWLTPEQTSGKQYPYMYSQCEDINCRTMIPIQDTPAIKITYGSCVYADRNLDVYMSANKTQSFSSIYGYNKHCFYSQIPIPDYLTAIIVGHVVYQSLGPNTGVISEPETIVADAACLSDLQIYLNTAIDYVQQDYVWGNYTIVVMPPSFPMGGMENPLLTFASPTIITADKSQVYVAIHEIAHSWTGNTVTMNNWEDFWLNEGFTTFIERKVSAIVFNQDFSMAEALVGNSSLVDAINNFGWTNTYSSCHPVLQGDNPDNSFSEVPYEKGFQLLAYMEQVMGYFYMEDFITYYIYNNAYKSIDQYTMRQTFSEFVDQFFSDP